MNNPADDGLVEDVRYVLFSIGSQPFGTRLLDVREVVEYQRPKPIPSRSRAILGMINIRGQVVVVVDLACVIGMKFAPDPRALMVFDSQGGPIAVVVDRVDAVQPIAEASIERQPALKSVVPSKYFAGVARHRDTLVTLLDIKGMLGAGVLGP